MNNLITSSPIQLAHDFVAGYSVDESAAINLLRLNLDKMSQEDIHRWFEEMAELFALQETSANTLIALLGVLESSSAPMTRDCDSEFETADNKRDALMMNLSLLSRPGW